MDPHPNLAYSIVTTPPSPALSGTSLSVAAGTGVRFGWTGSAFNATVWPTGERPIPSNAEIIRITNIAGDVLTITRAQEGTVARAILAGDQIAATLTQKSLTDIEAQLGVGGNVTDTGAEGAQPLGAADGDLYFPNNAPYVHRYNGTIWVPWGPIWSMRQPINGDFSWINQGGSSVVTTNGGVKLVTAVAGGGVRCRVKAAPATPYVITAFMRPLLGTITGAGAAYGLLFRESSTGRLHLLDMHHSDQGEVLSIKFTDPTTFSAVYAGGQSGQAISVAGFGPLQTFNNVRLQFPLNWLRIADDGVNRIVSYSPDGFEWIAFHTIGRTDFLTANQVGFFCADSVRVSSVHLLSWLES